MSEIERAANPTTEEAIKYLEGMIFTQDFSQSTLRAKAVNTMAIEALREKLERGKGCRYCQDKSYKQKGYYVDDPEGEIVGINHYCMNCGKRLEVEP